MDDVRDSDGYSERDGQRDFAAAAAVHAAKRELDGAIAELAASPLDQDAADRMRLVLGSARLRKARRALTRLQRSAAAPSDAPAAQDSPRPRLSVVDDVTGAPPSERIAHRETPRPAARLVVPTVARTTTGGTA